MVTDGAWHCTTLPSTLHTAGQSCKERHVHGAPRETTLTWLLPARQCHPDTPEQLGSPPVPAAGGGPCFSSISGAEGPPG